MIEGLSISIVVLLAVICILVVWIMDEMDNRKLISKELDKAYVTIDKWRLEHKSLIAASGRQDEIMLEKLAEADKARLKYLKALDRISEVLKDADVICSDSSETLGCGDRIKTPLLKGELSPIVRQSEK